jgi:hypothetical protein
MASCGSGPDLAAFAGDVTGELGSASSSRIDAMWRSGIGRQLALSVNHWATAGRLTPQA